MISIKNISKSFGGVKALNNCSLEISKEKITAVIGPNGSGKSTLFNVLSQLMNEDSGTIHLDGLNVTNKRDFEIAKLGISRTFQEVRLFKNMTIKEHLEIALSEKDESLIGSFFKKEGSYKEEINKILSLVKLNKSQDTLATDLSYGQRKLLDLAVAIAKPHKVLLLDEPVAGINPELRKEIKEILKKLSKKGETIVIIEHDMNFVMDLADYIYVLDEGSIIAQGKPKEIQNNKKVLEAYLGD